MMEESLKSQTKIMQESNSDAFRSLFFCICINHYGYNCQMIRFHIQHLFSTVSIFANLYIPVDIQRDHRTRTQNDTKIVELLASC